MFFFFKEEIKKTWVVIHIERDAVLSAIVYTFDIFCMY